MTAGNEIRIPEARAKGAKAYDDPSWWYDIRGFCILLGTYQVALWNHLNFFGRNVTDRHLEAAIGSGTFLYMTMVWNRLARRKQSAEIIGIDYAERMLVGAKRLLGRRKNMHLVQGDLTNIDYPDSYFTSVNGAHCVHAFSDPEAVLKELYRVMAPGATLRADLLLHPRGHSLRRGIATRFNNFCYRKGILARTYDETEAIAQFKRQQFQIDDATVRGNTLHIVACKPRGG